MQAASTPAEALLPPHWPPDPAEAARVSAPLMLHYAGKDARVNATGEPWVAAAPEEALGVEVIGPVDAALALVRAALLTDARVLCTDSRTAPDGEDVVALPHEADAAALLRWRTGPPVPGA